MAVSSGAGVRRSSALHCCWGTDRSLITTAPPPQIHWSFHLSSCALLPFLLLSSLMTICCWAYLGVMPSALCLQLAWGTPGQRTWGGEGGTSARTLFL